MTRLVEYHTGRTQLENQTDCEVFYHQAEEQEVSVDICVVPLTDYKEFHQDKLVPRSVVKGLLTFFAGRNCLTWQLLLGQSLLIGELHQNPKFIFGCAPWINL